MPPKAIITAQPQRVWLPDITPAQFKIFNNYARFLLVHGPRLSGKSLGIDHKICRHLWDNNGACFAVIGKTLRVAYNGAWRDLTRVVIPQWIASGIGMKWITPPSMLADSKMRYAVVSNRYGGESEIQLHSLEHEMDVDDKFRDTRFSGIYLVEADKHRVREPFEVLSLQLRSLSVPDDQLQMICDCNPPETAKRHWLYDVFFRKTGFTAEDAVARDRIQEIKITLAENPKAPPGIVASLRGMYRYDPVKYQRFVEGNWIEDSEDSHFSGVFRPDIHIVGDCSSRNKEEWETIVPPENTYEIFLGFDLGDIHHAMVMMCKRIVDGQTQFDVFDELVSIDKNISLEDFSMATLEKMDQWESYLHLVSGKKNPIKWKCWSDNSAMRYRSALDSHEQLEIYKISGGRIKLHGAFKGKGAIGERISLVKKLLFENRLFFSADCFSCQDMIRNLRAGAKKIALARPDQIEHGSIWKHCFDALSYCLAEEAPDDVVYSMRPMLKKGLKRTGLISIGGI